ncbi:hypothetical protein CSUI_004525, partial [Cystoisospora suis]
SRNEGQVRPHSTFESVISPFAGRARAVPRAGIPVLGNFLPPPLPQPDPIYASPVGFRFPQALNATKLTPPLTHS